MRWLALVAIAVGCARTESPPARPADSGTAARAATPAIESYVVNTGSQGMITRARWILSPDSSALLAMDDPAAVEADPVPNGFVLARSTGPVLQRDSVWDVAPSPDWERVAFARAYTSPPGERDSLTTAEWTALAARVGLPVDVVRAGAFSVSGMTYAYGTGRPVVVDLAAWDATPTDTTQRALPVAGAWRVAWTKDGVSLAVGHRGQRVQDAAPSERWTAVDPRTGARLGPVAVSDVAEPAWVEGPAVDISVEVDSLPRSILRGGSIEVRSIGGVVRRAERLADGTMQTVNVGKGMALAATRDGRVILALTPRPNPESGQHPLHLVVYRIPQQ
jgi:hypothetical protein